MKPEVSITTGLLSQHRVAVVVPTYNNEKTLEAVIRSLLEYQVPVYVVNDGSTDSTSAIMQQFESSVCLLSYHPNRGKGYALKTGFRRALCDGYCYAITIDSDGQHYASDLSVFAQAIAEHPDTLLVGSRGFGHENMAARSSFANRFSNFWFQLQTGIQLPDTQSGYRAYPLRKMGKMRLVTSRYEAELELLVCSAWRGIQVRAVDISVYYPPAAERVSHFRPFHDFFRISVLNSVLTLLALLYGYPSIFVRKAIKLILR